MVMLFKLHLRNLILLLHSGVNIKVKVKVFITSNLKLVIQYKNVPNSGGHLKQCRQCVHRQAGPFNDLFSLLESDYHIFVL